MKSSLSQQLSQKGINVSIYNPQMTNQVKQNSLYHQSAEKPRIKANGSLHSNNNQSLALDTQQSQIINQALAFSANFSSGKKTISQTNITNLKAAALGNQQQNSYTGIGKSISSAQKQFSQQQFEIPKDIQSLLQKKMISQQHRRAESTKLAQMNQNYNSFSTNVSSQKKGDNNFVFPETTDDSNLQLQTTTSQISTGGQSITVSQSMSGLKSAKSKLDMHQQYYSNNTKIEENISPDIQIIVSQQVSSRIGQNQSSPFQAASQIAPNNYNNHFPSPLQLTPNRDPNDGGRFFLNLGKSAKIQYNENPQYFQKSNSLMNTEQSAGQELQSKQEKMISDHKSQNNSPINNFFFGDNIVPLSAQIQKNQSVNISNQISTSQFSSPQKQNIKPVKVQICEPKNVIHYEKMEPIKSKNSYLQFQAEQLGGNFQSKSVNLMSSRSELSENENTQNHQLQIFNKIYPSNKANIQQKSQQETTSNFPSKQSDQIDSSNNKVNQEEQALVPPSQEEAKQQFQKILSTLQIQDKQNLLSELTNLYTQIFHLEDQQDQNQKKQEQQTPSQSQGNNKQYQASNGNDSTSTSSLDDQQGSSVKNKMTQEQREREEFLKEEEKVSLEQKVLLVNFIDINQDELFKLVREYYQTQTNDHNKYLSVRQEKISLQELLKIQKFIQDKLLERIDQEKKARLKTEEQTSMMLLNQEKTIKVMESKWQQQYESMRNVSTNSGNSNNNKQPSPQDISCTLNIMDQ